jgi:hypothetical protein
MSFICKQFALLNYSSPLLTPAEKLVLMVAADEAGTFGVLQTSVDNLATRSALSSQTVQRCLVTLRKHGLMDLVKRGTGGAVNCYSIKVPDNYDPYGSFTGKIEKQENAENKVIVS